MRWRRTDPVQTVGALIATGERAVARVAAAMAAKPAAFRALPVEHGEDWIVLFAGAVRLDDAAEPDPLLPRLAGTIALYAAGEGWWLPVGVALAAPDAMHAPLMRAMAEKSGVAAPAVIVPRLSAGVTASDEADVYPIRHPVPFDRSALRARGRAA